MREISIEDSSLNVEVLAVFRSENPVFMLRMPAVFVLMAPPTELGIDALHRTKNRLLGKNYGTAIGRVERFFELANKEHLPPFIRSADDLNKFTGSFIRFRIGDTAFNSDLVCNGTHQGVLIEEGAHRSLFTTLEDFCLEMAEPHLFEGKIYPAPLCTSANISGDVLGSITNLERALAFGRDRALPLFVNSNLVDEAKGSYPIFAITKNKISIERNGPGEQRIHVQIPEGYF